MARKPTGNPTGRPETEINWKHFEDLCGLQCTQSEMANFLNIHPNTLSDRVKDHYGEDYSTAYKRLSECGKCSLRRNQFILSRKNATMAIFLGKQWLGQKDPESDQKNNLPPRELLLQMEDENIRLRHELRRLNAPQS